jgi:hypothetical protein
MPMTSIRIDVSVAGDPSQQGAHRVHVQNDLAALGVFDDLRAERELSPLGSKAVDGASAGAIIGAIAQSSAVVAIVGALKAWISRGEKRSARVEVDGDVLELDALTVSAQREVIDAFLSRHARDSQSSVDT